MLREHHSLFLEVERFKYHEQGILTVSYMAQQPCRAVYLSEQLKGFLDGLGPSDKLRDWIDDMVDVLKENVFAGQRVKKNMIPDYYKRKYGVNNLYRYHHPEGFRSCYTLVRKDSHVCPVILDMLSHPEYDRIFGYETT